jgi:hypothetical protein
MSLPSRSFLEPGQEYETMPVPFALKKRPAPSPFRYSPRIAPPCPITVALEERHGYVVAYGVVADLSRGGGCIRTDVLLAPGVALGLRMSFATPPEMHSLGGTVAWSRADRDHSRRNAFRCGLQWSTVGHALRSRLRQLARVAVPLCESDRYLYEKQWVVNQPWPPPALGAPSPDEGAAWNAADPEATLPRRGREAVRWNPSSGTWEGTDGLQDAGGPSG